jgi:hypothetical protein
MALVGQSLNGATALGPGQAIMFDEPKAFVSMQVSVTGLATGESVDVTLQGTLDGVNWSPIPNASVSVTQAGSTLRLVPVGAVLPIPVAGLRAIVDSYASSAASISAFVAAA